MLVEEDYYLAFSHCAGIGPIRFNALLARFKSATKAYRATEQELKTVLGEKTVRSFFDFRNHFDIGKKHEALNKEGITIVAQNGSLYPPQFKTLADPPICLYVKGDLKRFNFKTDYFFGVVGTRKPTTYGQQVTKRFTRDLVEAGFVIVSGMATGIDTVAHQTAIEEGGRTIAILGCGVDVIYPAVNRHLYEQIVKKSGSVVSEFPPGQLVVKGLFVARNRLISGLTKGVLVVEGAKNSGALITARYASEQGKEVFAPPSPITSRMSEAPNWLLKQGAKLVTSVEDILEEFNLAVVPKTKEDLRKQLVGLELLIFDDLTVEPKLADELAASRQCSVGEILNALSLMEIKGVLEKNSEGKYQIRI